MGDKTTASLFVLGGVAISGAAIAFGVRNGQPASLEPLTPPPTSGMIVDYRAEESHVATVRMVVDGKTKMMPTSFPTRFYVTLAKDGAESEWEITEPEFQRVRISDEFTISNPTYKSQTLGIAVD